jgi:hypothetical protein
VAKIIEHTYGTLSRDLAGAMGIALVARHTNGETKYRFCEDRSETLYYEKILTDWLEGFEREESDYVVNRWGVHHKSEFPLIY